NALLSQSQLWAFWLRPPGWRGRMHNMALHLLQPTAPLQPTTLLQPMPRLHDMPVEPTVALLVRPIAHPLTVVLPLRSMPVVRPSPLALVGSPMPLLLDHMPQTLPNRMNGTAQ